MKADQLSGLESDTAVWGAVHGLHRNKTKMGRERFHVA